MGTWGAGLFDNDVALDVRSVFEDALSDGLDVSTATQRVFEEFADAIADLEDQPVVYLALAALQLEREALQSKIREEALRIITTGEGLAMWEEVDSALLIERKQVLEILKSNLVGT